MKKPLVVDAGGQYWNSIEDWEQNIDEDIYNNLSNQVFIEINKRSIKETFNFDNYKIFGKKLKRLKLATIRDITEVIKNGKIIIDNVDNKHNDNSSVKYAYIEGFVKVDSIPIKIKLSIRKSNRKNIFWVHNIQLENGTGNKPGGINNSLPVSKISDADRIVPHNKNTVNSKPNKKLSLDELTETLPGTKFSVFEGGTENSTPTNNVEELPPETIDMLEARFGTTNNYDVAGYLLTDGKW